MILAEENYVEKAEKAILELKNLKDERTGKGVPMVTTTKIRSILAMTADIYNEVMNCQDDKLSKEICGRIDYLKIRIIYEVGRDDNSRTVKNFVDKTQLLKCIEEIKGSKSRFVLFNRYLEALVAYHRFNNGKDN